MTSAFAALNSCAEYSKGVDYMAYVTLDKNDLISGNTVIYTFRASDQTYGDLAGGLATADSALTIQNDPPSLDWTGESNYTSDGVNPDYGPQNGTYYFRVKYADDDGDACPASGSANIQVWIDLNKNGAFDASEKFNLTEVSAADTDCTAVGGGKLYTIDVTPTTAATGIAYEFHASDGTDEALGDPQTVGGTVDVINATKVVRQDGSEDYTTLSAAISGTSSGATILVYDGTYNESVALSSLRNLYSACGAEETIIGSSNDPVVYFNHGYSSVIDGFTVTGGSGSGIYSAGTNFNGSQSTPTIKDCVIRNNGGRGISSYASLVTITGCEIYENTGGVSSYSTTISD